MRYAVHHHRHAFPSSEVERRLLRFTDEAPDDAPPATAEEPDRAEDAASALEPYLQRIQNELAYGDSNDVLSSAILQYITDNGELLEGNVTTLKSQIEKMLKDNNIRNVDSLLSRIPSDGQGFVDFAIEAGIISNYQENDAIKVFNNNRPQLGTTATYMEGEAPNSVTVPEKREVDVDAMAAEITALKQEVASYNMQRKALQEEMRAGMMPLRTQQKIAFRRAFLPRFQELRDSMNNPSARLSAALQNFYEINGFTYAGYLQGQRDAGGPRRDLEDGGYQMETPSGGLMTVRPRRQPLFVNTVTGKEYTDAGELNNLRTIKTYNRLGRGVVADDYFARMRLQDELGLTQYAEARRFKNGLGGMIADTRTETMALLSPEMMRGFDRRLATASRQGREVFKPYGNNYAVIGRKPSRMLVGFGFRGQNIQAPLKTRDGYSEYTTVDGRTIKFSSYTGETIRTRKQLEEAQNQYRKEKNAEEEKKMRMNRRAEAEQLTRDFVKQLNNQRSEFQEKIWVEARKNGAPLRIGVAFDGKILMTTDENQTRMKEFYYAREGSSIYLKTKGKDPEYYAIDEKGNMRTMPSSERPAFVTNAEEILRATPRKRSDINTSPLPRANVDSNNIPELKQEPQITPPVVSEEPQIASIKKENANPAPSSSLELLEMNRMREKIVYTLLQNTGFTIADAELSDGKTQAIYSLKKNFDPPLDAGRIISSINPSDDRPNYRYESPDGTSIYSEQFDNLDQFKEAIILNSSMNSARNIDAINGMDSRPPATAEKKQRDESQSGEKDAQNPEILRSRGFGGNIPAPAPNTVPKPEEEKDFNKKIADITTELSKGNKNGLWKNLRVSTEEPYIDTITGTVRNPWTVYDGNRVIARMQLAGREGKNILMYTLKDGKPDKAKSYSSIADAMRDLQEKSVTDTPPKPEVAKEIEPEIEAITNLPLPAGLELQARNEISKQSYSILPTDSSWNALGNFLIKGNKEVPLRQDGIATIGIPGLPLLYRKTSNGYEIGVMNSNTGWQTEGVISITDNQVEYKVKNRDITVVWRWEKASANENVEVEKTTKQLIDEVKIVLQDFKDAKSDEEISAAEKKLESLVQKIAANKPMLEQISLLTNIVNKDVAKELSQDKKKIYEGILNRIAEIIDRT